MKVRTSMFPGRARSDIIAGTASLEKMESWIVDRALRGETDEIIEVENYLRSRGSSFLPAVRAALNNLISDLFPIDPADPNVRNPQDVRAEPYDAFSNLLRVIGAIGDLNDVVALLPFRLKNLPFIFISRPDAPSSRHANPGDEIINSVKAVLARSHPLEALLLAVDHPSVYVGIPTPPSPYDFNPRAAAILAQGLSKGDVRMRGDILDFLEAILSETNRAEVSRLVEDHVPKECEARLLASAHNLLARSHPDASVLANLFGRCLLSKQLDGDARKEVLEILGLVAQMQPQPAIRFVQEAVKKDLEPFLFVTAFNILRLYTSPADMRETFRLRLSDPNVAVRLEVVRLLSLTADAGDSETIRILRWLAKNDADQSVKNAVSLILNRYPEELQPAPLGIEIGTIVAPDSVVNVTQKPPP